MWFYGCRFDAVIHFAGLKAVGESVAKPQLYYENNVIGTLNLYDVMTRYRCKKVREVFGTFSNVWEVDKRGKAFDIMYE